VRIKLKLFATLRDYLPQEAAGNAVEIEVPDDASPNSVLDRFQVPHRLCHLVLINGVYAEPEDRGSGILKDGDSLAIWPPVAGG
jgi:molybdopterin converting factor small subunit